MQSDGNSLAEMSSWTALTCHTGMKSVFETKSLKGKYLGIFIMNILNLEVIDENSF